uniref:type II secretion system minor pseudopilin GspK n=1 Tax=Ningiella ruwaisensis TaxID=2364274 RepID=UPI00109F8F2A|nr:type II secretion system minor pseudopilin GspK [Ningiella ruwaisensis]
MNSRYPHQKQQQGVALVVVVLIVALVVVLATQMMGRLQLNVIRTQNIKDNNQAYWYALGAEEFARKSISQLLALSDDNINLSQPWAQTFEYPVDGGTIKAELFDMQSCFNLNAVNAIPPSQGNNTDEQNSDDDDPNLADELAAQPVNQERQQNPNNANRLPSQIAFSRLLEFYAQDSFVVDTVTDSLIDWLDADDNPSNYGAEDLDYESLVSPYLAANNTLSSKTELRLVKGVSEGIESGWLKELLPLVCVVPDQVMRLNVNTVTERQAPVLAALLGDTIDTAQTIIANRPPEGFNSVDDFRSLPAVSALNLTPAELEWFVIKTSYFQLSTTAKYNDARFRLVTLFEVDSGDNGVRVVRREFGGF